MDTVSANASINNDDDDSDSLYEAAENSDDSDYACPTSRRLSVTKKLCRSANIITPELSSALDRAKISDRNATHVLAAAAEALGHSSRASCVYKESIRIARRRNRKEIASEICSSFPSGGPLTVHWDEKLLPALTSKESVNRIAVLVSGNDDTKLLGVPAIPNGSGASQSEAVFKLLEDWNLTTRVHFMRFDTTASNTGSQNGACTLLEQKMQKDLIRVPCRHHIIMELIVARVFDMVFGASMGPHIKLFQRFSEAWNSIDKLKFDT